MPSSAGRDILVHAEGQESVVAIKMAKALGCTIITTVGDDAKAEKPSDRRRPCHQLQTERFEGVVRS